ncbi:hypothetical protein T12_1003 [Trichinella patagoniensis]|uniref:Uncharacterized protein n=1 Tax=Trichinella patagoniensis TaxID=990121 RepID=A0A0V0YS07_9BILA|nr:hypothetical protein T12_1003 [Trichinella patagoniensis]
MWEAAAILGEGMRKSVLLRGGIILWLLLMMGNHSHLASINMDSWGRDPQEMKLRHFQQRLRFLKLQLLLAELILPYGCLLWKDPLF